MVTLRLTPPDRSVARSRVAGVRKQIEELLARDYAMERSKQGEYRLQVVYDHEPDGMSFDDEIEHLRTELSTIMETHRCPMGIEIVKAHRQPWEDK